MRKNLIVGSIVALAASGIATAQTVPSPPPVMVPVVAQREPKVPPNVKAGEIADPLLAQFHAGSTIEQYIAQVVTALRTADRDGNGLDRADIDLMRQTARASVRASAIAEVLRYDLDGDLKVTRAELEQSFPGRANNREQSIARMMERNDADGDGAISIEEAAAASVRDRYGDFSLDALLALDPDRDGKLMPAELQKLAQHAFEIVDQDGNGVISKDEDAAIAERRNQAARLRSRDRD
jgi:Ca2+-binding EF-hand superfamily protein